MHQSTAHGEGTLVLDAPRGTRAPQVRHAACGYDQRRSLTLALPTTRAFCGAAIPMPLPSYVTDVEKCAVCLDLAHPHAQRCDCWKLWPNGRFPR